MLSPTEYTYFFPAWNTHIFVFCLMETVCLKITAKANILFDGAIITEVQLFFLSCKETPDYFLSKTLSMHRPHQILLLIIIFRENSLVSLWMTEKITQLSQLLRTIKKNVRLRRINIGLEANTLSIYLPLRFNLHGGHRQAVLRWRKARVVLNNSIWKYSETTATRKVTANHSYIQLMFFFFMFYPQRDLNLRGRGM